MSDLAEQIRSVIDEAAPPITVAEICQPRSASEGHGTKLSHNQPTSRRSRWAMITVAAALVLVLAGIGIGSTPHSTSKKATVSTAFAQISRLVDSVHPLPPLQAGQWSSYQLHGDLTATVQLDTKPPIDTAASVPIDVSEWSNSTGATCTSQQLGTATFFSPANAQAWQSMGLVGTPANQPATGCDGDSGPLGVSGATLPSIDGSSITHDPETLVAQLQAGTTGIPRIDDVGSKELPQEEDGFIRLSYLLVGPITGSWPGMGQELLRAMALLPGVVALGTSTAHSGQRGLGFTSEAQFGAAIPVVVLDPNSGALLEARNLNMQVLNSEAEDFVGSSSAAVFSDGVGYGLTAQWIDPAASPAVVDQRDLPAWINRTHVISAVPKPATTSAEVNLIAKPYLAMGDTFAGEESKGDVILSYDITVTGTSTDEDSLVAVLNASGLFENISIEL